MHIKFDAFGRNKIESTNIKTISLRYNAPNHTKVSCNHLKKKKFNLKIIPLNWIINNGLVHELYDLQPHNERSKT